MKNVVIGLNKIGKYIKWNCYNEGNNEMITFI